MPCHFEWFELTPRHILIVVLPVDEKLVKTVQVMFLGTWWYNERFDEFLYLSDSAQPSASTRVVMPMGETLAEERILRAEIPKDYTASLLKGKKTFEL